MPLLSFDVSPASGADPTTLVPHRSEGEGEDKVQKKGWLTYAPLGVLLFIVFIPHPSYLITLSSFYLKTRHAPWRFGVHLLAVYALTIGTLASLVVCIVRDPGSVGRDWHGRNGHKNNKNGVGVRQDRNNTARARGRDPDTEDGVTTSLLRGDGETYDGDVHDERGGTEEEEGYETQGRDIVAAEDDNGEAASSRTNGIDIDALSLNGRWCGRCGHARPERAHHCGVCGRCILKMDHHCPWLAGNCIGHRTYPAFVHFLLMSTLLAAYISCVALTVVIYLISDPFSIDPRTSPLHALFLLLIGAVFTLAMGSFLLYHVYLVTTGQTTREHMSPFLLLRYIPPPPPQSPGSPPAYDIPSYTPYGSRDSQTHTHLAQPPFVDSGGHASPVSSESEMPLQLLHLESNNTTAIATARNTDVAARPFRTTLPYRPPDEHDLSPAQRRVAKHVHGQVRLFDLGWRRNWEEVFGGGRPRSCGSWMRWWRWVGVLVLYGGRPRGDGRTFEKGKGARKGLERLVRGLEDVRRSEGRGWKWGGE